MSAAKPLWVFGYGSLMWNPGFATPETQPARLHGWHRAFCIYSEHYRGTPEKPGLILGLLPGGACRGLAHRLPARDYEATRRYLWTREIDNDGVYEEAIRPIHLADGAHRVVAGLSRRPQRTASSPASCRWRSRSSSCARGAAPPAATSTT